MHRRLPPALPPPPPRGPLSPSFPPSLRPSGLPSRFPARVPSQYAVDASVSVSETLRSCPRASIILSRRIYAADYAEGPENTVCAPFGPLLPPPLLAPLWSPRAGSVANFREVALAVAVGAGCTRAEMRVLIAEDLTRRRDRGDRGGSCFGETFETAGDCFQWKGGARAFRVWGFGVDEHGAD